MKKNNLRPFVLFVAEVIYIKISEIKKNNKNLSNKEAIEKFIDSKNFDEISSGKFHENLIKELNRNNYLDQKTKKVPEETLRLLQIQKDITIKQLIQFPELYYAKSHYPLEISQRAFDHLWRMCESYELWSKETGQIEKLFLKITN